MKKVSPKSFLLLLVQTLTFGFSEEVSKKKGFLKSLFNKKSSSKKASPAPPPQEIYPDDDVDYDPPPMIAAPLERKRSMSKPTDLDEILRLQEEEEQRNVNHIFANDPFFNQSSTGQPVLPKRSPNPPSAVSFASISLRKVLSQSHYSKSQIFVQKFNFDKTPTFSRVFHPKYF